MEQVTFQRYDCGDLRVSPAGGDQFHLWTDEVDQLRAMLNRPTPAELAGQQIDGGFGCEVHVLHYPHDQLTVRVVSGDKELFYVDLDPVQTCLLRRHLGLMELREGETVDALVGSVHESWGDPRVREGQIRLRAERAWAIAAGRGPHFHEQ